MRQYHSGQYTKKRIGKIGPLRCIERIIASTTTVHAIATNMCKKISVANELGHIWSEVPEKKLHPKIK